MSAGVVVVSLPVWHKNILCNINYFVTKVNNVVDLAGAGRIHHRFADLSILTFYARRL